MSSRDPKEQENQKADQRQGGNLETKGASKASPSERAEKSDSPESGAGRPPSDEVE